MRKCFFVRFRFFAFFSQSKTGYAEQKNRPILPCRTKIFDQRRHCPSTRIRTPAFWGQTFFFIRTYDKNAFCVMQKIRTKNTINNIHKNEKTDSHLFNRSAFCSNGSIVFSQDLPGLSRLGCGKRHRRITAAKHLTPTTTNIDGEKTQCTKTKKRTCSVRSFFLLHENRIFRPSALPNFKYAILVGECFMKKS